MARPQPASTAADTARLFARAHASHASGALTQAEKDYKAVLEREPANVDALHFLGFLNHQLGRNAQALHYIAAALKQDANAAPVLASHGLVLHALGRADEALASYNAALARDPENADLINKRGVALLDLERADEALASFDRALGLSPQLAEAHGNRGNALVRLNRAEEALGSYDAMRAIDGETAQLLTNRAHALRRLDRLDEAVADLRKALALGPDYAEASFELGMAQLALGDFANGWAAYERRWTAGTFAVHRRDFTSPQWTGEQPLQGRTILLHAEQGLGDTLQFVRYVPLVAARGAKVILEVQPELARLLATMDGAVQVIARGEKLPSFDLRCPLMSLPRAFRTDAANIPAATPYIAVAEKDIAQWSGVLPARKPRIGICWAGRASHRNDANRSIALAQFARLFDSNALFVSLQYGASDADRALLARYDNVFDQSVRLNDFTDTAGLMKQLDAVVTVDTSVAHLAGALAVPTAVLLPLAADFRWLRRRDDCPWYPSVKLFRQTQAGDWGSVLARAAADLAQRFP